MTCMSVIYFVGKFNKWSITLKPTLSLINLTVLGPMPFIFSIELKIFSDKLFFLMLIDNYKFPIFCKPR